MVSCFTEGIEIIKIDVHLLRLQSPKEVGDTQLSKCADRENLSPRRVKVVAFYASGGLCHPGFSVVFSGGCQNQEEELAQKPNGRRARSIEYIYNV